VPPGWSWWRGNGCRRGEHDDPGGAIAAEIGFRQRAKVGGGDGFDVGEARARPVEHLGFFLGAGQHAANPITIIAERFLDRGQRRLLRADELVVGHTVLREIVAEGDHRVGDPGGHGGLHVDGGGEIAVVGEGVAREAARIGAVGAAELFADFDAEAVAEHAGEQCETARAMLGALGEELDGAKAGVEFGVEQQVGE